MGLLKALMGSVGGTLSDQWKEYFYCDSMPEDVMADLVRQCEALETLR